MVAYGVAVDATVTHAGSPFESFSAMLRIAPMAASSSCAGFRDLDLSTSVVSATEASFSKIPMKKSNKKLLLHKYVQDDQ